MKRDEFDAIVNTMRRFVEGGQAAQVEANKIIEKHTAGGKTPPPAGNGTAAAAIAGLSPDLQEQLYQSFKNRMIDEARVDPVLLHLLTTRPELVVEVEPRVVELDGDSLRGRVARLLAAGWFKERRSTSSVRSELSRTGADPGGGGRLSEALAGLQRDGFLTREGDGWQLAPGVKITERELTRGK